ncbi:MAG: uroporphyrin-3 C-methyltransferase [Gammaproteobacteria bacterium]
MAFNNRFVTGQMAKKKMNKDKNKGNNDNASLDQQADEASRLDAKSDDDFEQAKEAEAIEAAPLAIEQTVEATEAAKPVEPPKSDKPDESAKSERKRRPWFSAFNFLLILCLAAAGAYYWYLQQQVGRDYRATIVDLQQQIAAKVTPTALENSLQPLQQAQNSVNRQLADFDQRQLSLQQASEKLYELFGRDKNDWQLAEVEYLMRIAQHKLILQHDFEGAAATLQAANDKIGETADPGLLPVRVKLSEEMAALKTGTRTDLVGIALKLAQLGRQAWALTPGFAVKTNESEIEPSSSKVAGSGELGWQEQLRQFIDSLVKVRHETTRPSKTEANIADVAETLAANLKLARWAVLDRNEKQYQQLIDASLKLMQQFYNLDDAVNQDFYGELKVLQTSVIKPELPAIGGSLQMLRFILEKRENLPVEVQPTGGDSTNG